MGLLLGTIACTVVPSPSRDPVRPVDCSPTVEANALPLTKAGPAALAGRFTLIQLATSNSVRGPTHYVSRSALTLELVDSAQRAAASVRSLGREPRKNLQLLGRREYAAADYGSEPAEVDDGVLWLDCRDCTDSFGTAFRIERVTAVGFFGSWARRDPGFAVVIDVKTGKTEPVGDMRGYFCAWRVP